LITSLYSFLYSAALALGMLASSPYWLFQMVQHGKYRKGFAERLGRVPARLQLPGVQEPVIWVHAVSVGEVLAVAGVAEELRRRCPQHRIFVSTTTDTGQALARKRLIVNAGLRPRPVWTAGRASSRRPSSASAAAR